LTLELDALRERLTEDLRRLKAPEGYLRAGAPRYSALFGRDSLIAAWQTLDLDPTIAAATLRVLASYQGRVVDRVSEEQPGKILHEHRFDAASRAELPQWKFPYYGSIDSTLLFLIVGAAYLKKTEDRHLARELWTAFRSAHEWIGRYGDADGDGFIEYERTNPAGLFHQGWKDGSGDHLRIRPPVALVEVQGYAVAAHAAFASLAEAAEEGALASVALEAAESVRRQVNRDFWLEDQGFFGIALDGTKQIRRAVTSNPGHLLLCGAVEPRRLDAMISRLFSPDLWTSFGIRTHSSREPDFDPASYHLGSVWPHDNWFLFRGLLAVGREAEAQQVREALLKAYETLGRMPELYGVVDDRLLDLSREETSFGRANPVQAWASAGLLDMISRDPDAKVSP
jgi:glycogen debranching enzyme